MHNNKIQPAKAVASLAALVITLTTPTIAAAWPFGFAGILAPQMGWAFKIPVLVATGGVGLAAAGAAATTYAGYRFWRKRTRGY